MRILHLCLSNFYIDDFNYQENLLPRQNKADGHDVAIIASTETFVKPGKIGYVKPSCYIGKDGIKVTRVAYKNILPHFIMTKVRSYRHIYEKITEFAPDVILHHGVSSSELLTLARYKKEHPKVKVYLDSHEDYNNSALNYISRELLHRRFYRVIIQKALPYIDGVLCVASECFDFLEDHYRIPRSIMEYYPLGGVVFSDEIHKEICDRIRKELLLSSEDILVVHSGKMDKMKRTEELLLAFTKAQDTHLKLILIGSLSEDIEHNVLELIASDERIHFLGWKNGNELLEYLCACDLYIQPGSQSATMQNALCCRSAVALYPHKSHIFLLKDSAFYVKTIDDIIQLFCNILEERSLLESKKKQGYSVAKALLDYKVLASRLYR